MYLLTGFGITIGYHRLFTHRSFSAPAPVRLLLAIFGSMAIEGPVLTWVAEHRLHHQHSDHESDPHSPHLHGGGFSGLLKGLWHSHMGWLFAPEAADLPRYVGDLQKDRVVTFADRWFILWAAIGVFAPAVLVGLITFSWGGLLMGFLWAGLARVFLVHHITWSINSVCHLWGRQPFRSRDESRNNAVFGVLAMGEGWHNNHHAFPTSARHGLRWWELDASYGIICLMGTLGLASDIKVPDQETIAHRLKMPERRSRAS
jgi:stearoyl-CoA desaturase (delta-9 desaturase)